MSDAHEYAALWCKSSFSFLEGASHVEELIEEAARRHLRAIALTDRDGVYGMVRAHVKARALGVKLICGAQLTVAAPGTALAATPMATEPHGGIGWNAIATDDAPHATAQGRRARKPRADPRRADDRQRSASRDDRGQRSATRDDRGQRSATRGDRMAPAPSRIVVLAADRAGWANLTRLITAGRRRCDKGDSLISWDELCAHAGGLVALWRDLLAADAPLPPQLAGAVKDAFGDRLYALVARHRSADEVEPEARLRARAAALNLPLVAATEVLYHAPPRRQLQDVLACLRAGVTLATAGRVIRGNAEHALLAAEPFARRFADEPALVARTLDVAARCTFALDELRYRYPSEPLPDGSTSIAHLRALTYRGAASHFPAGVPETVRAQIETELAIIDELDYPGYFLTMHEIVAFCARNDIMCQGRGSAANSAVCFCLGVTAVNPATHKGLLFERFLSRERREPPDIDLDIEHERREEVIQHVYRVYGRDRAAMACNVVRYRQRSALRDVGKVLGIPETALDRTSKFLTHGRPLDAAVLAQSGIEDRPGRVSVLEMLARLANELVEFPRHLSIHPGGFLLGSEPVHDIVPVENASMADRTVIQWDKDDLEELGLFKLDLLALGALHQLHLAFDLIAKHRGERMTMATMPQGDAATFAMICTADTIGTFQIESRAQMSMLPRLKPKDMDDLIIQISIVRPGPITGGMVHPYLRRRNKEEPVVFPHPCLEGVLGDTCGVPLFQEQVMQLAIVAADYTPGEADQLRRDMAAWRRTGQIDRHKERLISRMTAKGISLEFADSVFKQILGFGSYGFPRAHAASFALIAYATSYLRCHYMPEFVCSLLNAQPMGFYAPATIVGDAQRHGLDVRPIDVQHSAWHCTLEPSDDGFGFAVRMGLRWIRGLQYAEGERVAAARPYRSIEDVVRRARLPAGKHRALAEAGALGSLGGDGTGGGGGGMSRRDALWQVSGWIARQHDALAIDDRIDADVDFAPLSRLDEIQWDFETSQHSTRGHPLAPLRAELRARRLPDARTVAAGTPGARIDFVGVVICRQRPGTAAGVVFMTLEDETGLVNAIVWPRVFAAYEELARTARVVGVSGTLQVQEKVVHVVADKLWDPELSRPVPTAESHDFH